MPMTGRRQAAARDEQASRQHHRPARGGDQDSVGTHAIGRAELRRRKSSRPQRFFGGGNVESRFSTYVV